MEMMEECQVWTEYEISVVNSCMQCKQVMDRTGEWKVISYGKQALTVTTMNSNDHVYDLEVGPQI